MSVGILSSSQIVMSELPFRPPGPGPAVLFPRNLPTVGNKGFISILSRSCYASNM